MQNFCNATQIVSHLHPLSPHSSDTHPPGLELGPTSRFESGVGVEISWRVPGNFKTIPTPDFSASVFCIAASASGDFDSRDAISYPSSRSRDPHHLIAKASTDAALVPDVEVCSPGTGDRRGKMQKSRFRKFEISKIANCKNKKLKNFCRNFSTRSIANLFPARSYSSFRDQRQDFRFFALFIHSQCARCILNAGKQCPYEATTFYLAEQPW
jgi:hypothetical protein